MKSQSRAPKQSVTMRVWTPADEQSSALFFLIGDISLVYAQMQPVKRKPEEGESLKSADARIGSKIEL
jgi:hypothetical protein